MQTWVASEALLLFKTGVNHDELDFIWRMVRKPLADHYGVKHTQHGPPLFPYASLLLTLYWLRHYPSSRCLAAEFDTSYHTIDEVLQHTIAAMHKHIVPAVEIESSGLHHVYRAPPLTDVRIMVDSTWLTLPCPSDAADRKTYYHFKSPTRAALKWQLATTTTGEPFDISEVVPVVARPTSRCCASPVSSIVFLLMHAYLVTRVILAKRKSSRP